MRLKKIFLLGLSLMFVTTLFGQTYEEYLAKAKQYEAEKRWCYALGAYYDAMSTNISLELKQEAYDGYVTLRNAILHGQPGLGKFNVFTLHDEWKKLLMDAEKFGSSNNLNIIEIGDLIQGNINYENRTASYSAKINVYKSQKYQYTLGIITQGLRAAYQDDWVDIPVDWPLFSVSYEQNKKQNESGVLTFLREAYNTRTGEQKKLAFNAFEYSGLYDDIRDLYFNKNWDINFTPNLFDYKFNIVDENGKEIVKGKRWLWGESDEITFSDIPVSVMELIDNGKAFVQPIACYLQYGEYNSKDDKGGRLFIKNFPEMEISLNNNLAETDNIVEICMFVYYDLGLVEIPGLNIEMGKTEVTQELYQLVMVRNPSSDKGLLFPITDLDWYDAISFCNYLSSIYGYNYVYSVDGEIDPGKWRYICETGLGTCELQGEVVINESANGFRLPNLDEWIYAAKGGEDFSYAGSNNIDEVAWFSKNSEGRIQAVAQKKSNGYGLYDMTGNVSEWTSTLNERGDRLFFCGGSFNYENGCEIYGTGWEEEPSCYYNDLGFRLVRTVTE